MQDIEIEIQVKIGDRSKLGAFLAKEAKPVGKIYQKDEYYTPQHRNFVGVRPAAEWLRLRESSGNSITYKNWYYKQDGTSDYCDEYETKLDNIEQMRKIFAALDIQPLITVEKTRELWHYKDYEVALDHVTGLGDFVEVEFKGNTKNVDPEKITADMIKFLKRTGCGKIEINHLGYPFMLLYPAEVKFISV